MREIKFRAWNTHELVLVPDVTWSHNKTINEHLNDGYFLFMQYTGLKDKNGKEIYEGDIVDCKTYSHWGHILEVENMVEWRQQLDYEFDGKSEQPEDLEVIGNIYENPELLN